MTMSKEANYGNWVPEALMKTLWTVTAALCAVTVLLFVFIKSPAAGIISAVITLAAFCFTFYMQRCRKAFDFKGGAVMGNVHQFLVDHFPWEESRRTQGIRNGSGFILDIGCGAAALTNRVAKTYPEAHLIGMDYWGPEWSYAKEQCEKNAEAEGVADRVSFQKGDAAKLDFEDAFFDGAVSNFVFHEVRSAKDKRDVVREALRVIKPGGAFAFQDLFGQKKVYGDMEEFLQELQKEGLVREIHYIANIENKASVPSFIQTPWMVKDAGLIYGIR